MSARSDVANITVVVARAKCLICCLRRHTAVPQSPTASRFHPQTATVPPTRCFPRVGHTALGGRAGARAGKHKLCKMSLYPRLYEAFMRIMRNKVDFNGLFIHINVFLRGTAWQILAHLVSGRITGTNLCGSDACIGNLSHAGVENYGRSAGMAINGRRPEN
ncbi:hypothetical protein BaRGS_00012409 [Batillaria attramentaria]|uniref:Uncharacterized protein n=1 Tax=Batillaria attramentaria TaxID=370345 RepID=A0ABD0L9K7_9CAEN